MNKIIKKKENKFTLFSFIRIIFILIRLKKILIVKLIKIDIALLIKYI